MDRALADAAVEILERDAETTPAERTRAEAARLLAMYDEYAEEFGERWAAAEVARRQSRFPQEREIIAQRVRRLVRRRKASTARLAG